MVDLYVGQTVSGSWRRRDRNVCPHNRIANLAVDRKAVELYLGVLVQTSLEGLPTMSLTNSERHHVSLVTVVLPINWPRICMESLVDGLVAGVVLVFKPFVNGPINSTRVFSKGIGKGSGQATRILIHLDAFGRSQEMDAQKKGSSICNT